MYMNQWLCHWGASPSMYQPLTEIPPAWLLHARSQSSNSTLLAMETDEARWANSTVVSSLLSSLLWGFYSTMTGKKKNKFHNSSLLTREKMCVAVNMNSTMAFTHRSYRFGTSWIRYPNVYIFYLLPAQTRGSQLLSSLQYNDTNDVPQ